MLRVLRSLGCQTSDRRAVTHELAYTLRPSLTPYALTAGRHGTRTSALKNEPPLGS